MLLVWKYTHEHSSLLAASQRRGHTSAQTTPHCERECAADWIIQEKAKIAVCPNHQERDRAGHRGSGKGSERGTMVKSAGDPPNSTHLQSIQVLVKYVSRGTKQYKVCLVLTHPPIILYNIALIQMCHRAKAPNSRGPSPPPQPPTSRPPNRFPNQLDLIMVSQWCWSAVSPTEYASNLFLKWYKITTKALQLNPSSGWFLVLSLNSLMHYFLTHVTVT